MRRPLPIALILLILLLASGALAQPPAPVRMCAEWEPVEGVMIRFPLGISLSLVAEMAEDVTVYVIIRQYQIASATSSFTSAGVNMDNVQWFVADSYSHWSRDWGPQVIFDGQGNWGIGDPWFDGYPWVPRGRGYEDDDDTPGEFAAYLGEPLWQPPFYLTGGNFMTDGHGRGFCSRAQLTENDHLGEVGLRSGVLDWFGIDQLEILPNTEVHGIQHIDCVAKLLDEETILVKQVAPSHDDYEAIELNATILAGLTSCYGRPYRIVRVDCGPFGGVGTAAYTNSLILGKKVLVPFFNCSGDEAARQVIADAMPGYEVIGFTGSWYYYDALHCRTMGIFDRGMLRVDVTPPADEIPFGPHQVNAFIDDRSESGLVDEQCLLHWRLAGQSEFNQEILAATAETDILTAWIPSQLPGSEIEYYVSALDSSGRRENRPIAAPVALFHTRVTDSVSDITAGAAGYHLSAWPRPFNRRLHFSLGAAITGDDHLDIYDISGRRVRHLPLGGSGGVWNGDDDRGRPLPAGIYLLRPGNSRHATSLKVLKLR